MVYEEWTKFVWLWIYSWRAFMNIKKQEVLRRINRLLFVDTNGPHWKRRVQQFFCCCMCIRNCGDVSIEPFPINNKGEGYTDTHAHIQTTTWSHKPVFIYSFFFQNKESRLRGRKFLSHLSDFRVVKKNLLHNACSRPSVNLYQDFIIFFSCPSYIRMLEDTLSPVMAGIFLLALGCLCFSSFSVITVSYENFLWHNKPQTSIWLGLERPCHSSSG
jgi:hypothetical protein